MIGRFWRWLTTAPVSQHREMVEGDLWPAEWAYARYRADRLARHRLHQPSLLELGKQLGIYPARTIEGPNGPIIPALPDEAAERADLHRALRARRA